MTEQVPDGSGLDAIIERAMAGAQEDVIGAFLGADLVVPSGAPVGEGFAGFVPVLYDREGVQMLAVFTTFDRAREVTHQAPYAITLRGSALLAMMPDGSGVVVNPGHRVGFEMSPDGVRQARAR
jgi:hypothetical protein